ncbi:MAG: SDR family NAD(P)-dependent oxidoreductase [Chloroflexi bacterium]|nr:MAG: SDR family NAD(P)-dependent oxidoreductase [Chloroflexota bacterium]
MPRKIQDSVVVITGASSGIGKATALAFAKKGASVVVAARREAPLQDLADRALETFGRIDVWVNNHGVTLFARFEEAPMEDYRRVIEVDLLGSIYGARVVLPIFREQGAGTLINQGSMVSKLSEPYVSSYVAAKHGIRGLGMSLRQELALNGSKQIHVCTVMPATIDTPFFQHAANYLGRAAKAMPPVYPPERVARTIVNLARWPRREVFVGNAARMFWWQYLLAPGLTERMMAVLVDKLHLYQDKMVPPTSGNLFEPMAEGTSTSGGWRTMSGRNVADRRSKMPGVVLGVAGLVSLLLALLGRIDT